MKISVLLMICLALATPAAAQNFQASTSADLWPMPDWTVVTPESQGMSSADLAEDPRAPAHDEPPAQGAQAPGHR
ncbi:MAG TPA: hypothetical protein VGM86_09270 [Thermoanaerobaculia bacterium]|jgi:hypothetical protein